MKESKCFVIGPMNKDHIDKLHWLADKVISKILVDKNFHVFTPDVNEVGNIMNHVIKSADRADLVIADITGNNPNVLYEIGLLNSLGKVCIPIKQTEKEEQSKDLPPFDLAQYRYFEILSWEDNSAINKLTPVINNALRGQIQGEIPSNPITDFFGVTLSSLSSARGLAKGYFRNFIIHSIKGKIESIEGEPKNFIGATNLDIHIIIANKLAHSTRWSVEKLKEKGVIIPVVLQAEGRKITAYVWNDKLSKKPILIDVPTAMGQLAENVNARLGQLTSKDPFSSDYIELEKDEISQFKTHLQSHIFKEPDSPVAYKVKIIDVNDSICPNLFDALS